MSNVKLLLQPVHRKSLRIWMMVTTPLFFTSLSLLEKRYRAAPGDTPCDKVQDCDSDICDDVQVYVRNKFLWSLISGGYVFLREVTILTKKTLQWGARKFRDQNFGSLLRLRHRSVCAYLRMTHISDWRRWGLVVNVAELCLFADPPFLVFVITWTGFFTILLKKLRQTLSAF